VPSNIELVKLHAAIADIDEKLQKLKANRSLPAGKKLLEEQACGRERMELELRIQLFREGEQIKHWEGQSEFYQTPLGESVIKGTRHSAEKHHQRRRAYLGLGGGSSTPYRLAQKDVFTPPNPGAEASIALTRAREQHAATSRELEKLCRENAEWNEATIAPTLAEHGTPVRKPDLALENQPRPLTTRNLNYRSLLKRAVLVRLTQKPDATNRGLCDWLDDEGAELAALPPNLAKNGNRSFADAYLDDDLRRHLESSFSKVRKDMREAGLLR
jgi:hypothetical protein